MIRMATAPNRTIFVHEYVTGGGLAGEALPPSWSAEGGAMRRALAEDFAALPGVRVVVTLDDRLPPEDGPWEVVRVGPGQEPEAFARHAAESSWTALIAPETGGILADRARRIEGVGGRSLGASPAAIGLAGDKLATAARLRASGVPTPEGRAVNPALGLPRDAAYPAVLKPNDGAGSIDTYYLRDADDLPDAAKAMTVALLQPFLRGTPMAASFLVGRQGNPQLVGMGVQRLGPSFEYRGGTVPAGDDVPVEPLFRALRAVPGLMGWVGVDFLRDEAGCRLTVLEINPRLTTSYVGLRRLLPRGELARIWLALLEGDTSDLESLSDRVRAHAPLTFAADGSILSADGGPPDER